jgi:hypothetical protein
LKPGSQGKKIEKVIACVVGWLFVCLFVDGFGICCCWWLAGWLFNAVAVVVLWWAASVAAAAAVAAADAVLARTPMLVLQPLDPWEAPRPRAPPTGPLSSCSPFPRDPRTPTETERIFLPF